MNEVFIIVANDNTILSVCRSKERALKELEKLFNLFYDLKPQIIKQKLV